MHANDTPGTVPASTLCPGCQAALHQETEGTDSLEKCKACEATGCSFDLPPCNLDSSSTLCFLCSDPTFPFSPIPNLSKTTSGPPAIEPKTTPPSSASSGSLLPLYSLTPGLPQRVLSSECGIQVEVVQSPSLTTPGPCCPGKEIAYTPCQRLSSFATQALGSSTSSFPSGLLC